MEYSLQDSGSGMQYGLQVFEASTVWKIVFKLEIRDEMDYQQAIPVWNMVYKKATPLWKIGFK